MLTRTDPQTFAVPATKNLAVPDLKRRRATKHGRESIGTARGAASRDSRATRRAGGCAVRTAGNPGLAVQTGTIRECRGGPCLTRTTGWPSRVGGLPGPPDPLRDSARIGLPGGELLRRAGYCCEAVTVALGLSVSPQRVQDSEHTPVNLAR